MAADRDAQRTSGGEQNRVSRWRSINTRKIKEDGDEDADDEHSDPEANTLDLARVPAAIAFYSGAL